MRSLQADLPRRVDARKEARRILERREQATVWPASQSANQEGLFWPQLMHVMFIAQVLLLHLLIVQAEVIIVTVLNCAVSDFRPSWVAMYGTRLSDNTHHISLGCPGIDRTRAFEHLSNTKQLWHFVIAFLSWWPKSRHCHIVKNEPSPPIKISRALHNRWAEHRSYNEPNDLM